MRGAKPLSPVRDSRTGSPLAMMSEDAMPGSHLPCGPQLFSGSGVGCFIFGDNAPKLRRFHLWKSMAGRDLIVILGDQLDRQSPLLSGTADPSRDYIWMAEVGDESTHVWSHQARIAVFLSAMRHFRDELRACGWTVDYREIDARPATLSGAAIASAQPELFRFDSLPFKAAVEWDRGPPIR